MKRIIKKLIPSSIRQRIGNKLRQKYGGSTVSYVYNINKQDIGRAEGKVALVTGGTGAIGSAICLRLATEGALVGICGRNIEKINATISIIKDICPEAKVEPVVLDVTNDANIESAITDFAETHGRLDIFINNAGGGSRGEAKPLRDQEISILDSVLDTNLRGAMICAKYASKIMVKQKAGKLISMSSVMGMNGKENWSEYSASKSGILGLTKSLALELGEYNITVNAVSPGMVQQVPFDRARPLRFTHTNALKRFGYTDEVAILVAFLCSDEANYITGQNFVIDGGRSIGLK